MLICDEFVLLNFPKTGSSFARAAVKAAFKERHNTGLVKSITNRLGITEAPLKELYLPNIKVSGQRKDQHGTYSQIPNKYLDRKVVSVVRNPYSKFISGYEFKFWAKKPPLPKSEIEEFFPSFPDLTMDEFVDFQKRATRHRLGDQNSLQLGNQTIQFIQMFFKDPQTILKNLDEKYIASDQFKEDIGDVTFLRQESLKGDLTDFLASANFSKAECDIVRNYKRVNTTKSKDNSTDKIWTAKAIDYLKDNEAFLFRMLEYFGLTYEVPKAGMATR